MFDLKKHITAASVDEAIGLLIENPDARLIAGGTDVLIKLRHGKQTFSTLVDIHGLDELKGIKIDGQNNILIGSGASFTDIIQSDILKQQIPMLCEAAQSVGGPQIRNVATIGGNICNGVTSADSASSLFALNAMVVIRGDGTLRQIPISDFYLGPGKVDLKTGEILTSIIITPENYQGFFGHYYKYAMRNAMDIATIGCAVSLKTCNHLLTDFRIAYGVAGPVPMRCSKTENSVLNKRVSQNLIEDIFLSIETDVSPRTSWRASREFRMNIIKELSKRVTKEALIRAGEQL
ncbi:MAG: xanthine dehydrogenase FAD-binding subunit XdhB [Proteobacteria bacterium]|nr:xanthine dehydrogenase FAD-binding subunit XdhB [Pseudomonadota bacterium]MBU1582454.1 xanthine dehydrogenase FAD-binding subunit XdhB [Pseudomonadota bacterium]MBU2452165.1 xanthine dehydrogenase FAD-binding subunit XdhB [Pseudomonadota bacterium]MBU2630635.1 xanthine dehydrogenase FAD-binding subunit XdhB [Pseudomonadota bacterium]